MDTPEPNTAMIRRPRTRGVKLRGDVLDIVERAQRHDGRPSLTNAAERLIREAAMTRQRADAIP